MSWKTDGIDGRTLYPNKVNNYGVSPDLEFRWIGGNVKSVISTKVFANKKAIICLELRRKGKKKEILDTVFCARDAINSFSFKY